MTFMPLAVVAAVLLVVATRGSLLRLGQLPLRALDVLFAGLVLQVVLALVHIPHARLDDVGFGLLIGSYALILTFCVGNLHVRGMTIVLIGVALNATVIALNQGMPADGPTRTTADGRQVSRVVTSVKHRPQRAGDLLTVLDDRIMLPRPSHDLLSFGDLVLVAGLLDVCYWGSRRRQDVWQSAFALPAVAGSPSESRAATPAPTLVPAEVPETVAPAPVARAPAPSVRDAQVAIEEQLPEPAEVEDNAAFLAYDSILDLGRAEREEREAQAGDTDPWLTTRSSAASTSGS
ncbi:MAG: DUF5317 domain-containing protein [Actinobacteria bacterium]|nr:DUF5317 domain-containing protein [Actinomycetota bacterium]